MAGRRTRSGRTFCSGQSRTGSSRAAAIAQELHHECKLLIELYKKRENLSSDFTCDDVRLVSVPSSSQLPAKDRLWLLLSALRRCRGLLERAISREEEEFGSGESGEYESARVTVRDRLARLLDVMRCLLEEMEGTAAFTPDPESIEIDGPSSGDPFKLKRWIFGIFCEVEHWSDEATATLRALPTDGPRKLGRARNRASRGTPN